MRPRLRPSVPSDTERGLNVALFLIAAISLLITLLVIATVFGLWLKFFWFGWVMAGH